MTFHLNLTEDEKAARDQVKLPYMHQGEQKDDGEGLLTVSISMLTLIDEEEDEDEDLDDDLDI